MKITVLLILLALILSGCSSSNDMAVYIDPVTGKHAAGWLEAGSGGNHPATARSVGFDICRECHGIVLRGGIAQVSCFSTERNGIACHPNGPSGHPLNWRDAAQHGQAGAKGAPGAARGFVSCTACHGSIYTNGAAPSCLSCHTKAPHPDKPWRGTTATATTHTNSDPGNATQCALCHGNGANSSVTPTVPAASGTAPGCFNNTLCHGAKMSHALPNAGASHKNLSSVADCLGCHHMGSNGAVYPTTAGTPPDCRSCHLFADPLAGSHCTDCHGSDSSGRPSGTAFPNKAGRHGKHASLSCDVCHSGGGSGVTTHGNSNRQVKSFKDVVIRFSGAASGMSATVNTSALTVTCNGSCHGENHGNARW